VDSSEKERGAVSNETTTIRVLAADDHALLRYGIASLVNAQPDMSLVAQAATGREALELFRRHRPDITLMDLQMPDISGIEAIIGIRSEFPDARIIVLTTYSGDVQIVRALRAGARGYLLKGSVHTDLVETIRAVHAGQKRVLAEIAAELAEYTGEDDLTPREVDVLRLIAKGNANKEIAAQLSIAEETVKSHVTRILDKLRANDRTHAVTIGLERGIIELQTSPKSRISNSQF
jgi:DNA-binding NarL/FixJ family response regulator